MHLRVSFTTPWRFTHETRRLRESLFTDATLMEWSAELDNLSKLAPDVGLEPTTLWLTARCSTYWANQEYRILASRTSNEAKLPSPWDVSGGSSGTRTLDRPVMSQMLWPTELRIQITRLSYWISHDASDMMLKTRRTFTPLDDIASSSKFSHY